MPKAVERCVRKLKHKKGINNPYAVCQASHNKKVRKRKMKHRKA